MRDLFGRIYGERVMLAVDVSASMSPNPNLAEKILSALQNAGVTQLDLVVFDYEVLQWFDGISIEDAPALLAGHRVLGGGSNFCPVAELADAEGIDILVVLGDLYMSYPREPIKAETFWMRTCSEEIPSWGTTYDLDTAQRVG